MTQNLYYGQQQPVGPPPDNNLVWAILVTVFCCLPLGIVSIVKNLLVAGATALFGHEVDVSPVGHFTEYLLLGAALGLLLTRFDKTLALQVAGVARPIGRLWLNALQMTVVPLVTALVIVGVNTASNAAASGRTARNAILVFIVLLVAAASFSAVVTPALLGLVPHDSATMQIVLENGGLGTVAATRFATGHLNDLRLRLFGDEGGLEVSFENRVSRLRACLSPDLETATWHEVEAPPVPTMYQRFIAAIRGEGAMDPDFARGAALQRLLDRAEESSADAGRALAV